MHLHSFSRASALALLAALTLPSAYAAQNETAKSAETHSTNPGNGVQISTAVPGAGSQAANASTATDKSTDSTATTGAAANSTAPATTAATSGSATTIKTSVNNASSTNGTTAAGNATATTPATAATATVPGTGTAAATTGSATANPPKMIYVPGKELSIGTDSEDLVITDDVAIAKAQVAKYPTSPEAHFILAVAMTRTSYVEEALKEVRFARRLAATQGGAAYFDNMIATDEKMLASSPKDNKVRYSLAWAYYMKAYVIAQQSHKAATPAQPSNSLPLAQIAAAIPGLNIPGLNISGVKVPDQIAPIQGALDKADPSVRPQVKKYFESAFKNLDGVLAQDPTDVWAKVYRAHLKCEYTGNLNEAMVTWANCRDAAPENPAPYFFLGEGYMKLGDLKNCLANVSKAVALRAMGK